MENFLLMNCCLPHTEYCSRSIPGSYFFPLNTSESFIVLYFIFSIVCFAILLCLMLVWNSLSNPRKIHTLSHPPASGSHMLGFQVYTGICRNFRTVVQATVVNGQQPLLMNTSDNLRLCNYRYNCWLFFNQPVLVGNVWALGVAPGLCPTCPTVTSPLDHAALFFSCLGMISGCICNMWRLFPQRY